MAEGLLFDTVGRLLEVLGSQVFQEIGLACGVKDEIRKLKGTVETIQAVLLDAEEQHNKKNHQVTLWLRKLKDAIYDVDDLLDDFAIELKQREVMIGNKMTKEVRIFFSKSNQLAYFLKIGHKIKIIRERLDAIKNDRQFHLDEKPVGNMEREQVDFFVCPRAEDVIGRDDDRNNILQLLLDPNNDVENISIIPIVGIGGLGKTTLGKLIYNDDKVKRYFKLRIWVHVSNVFDVRIIVKNIIKFATGEDVGEFEVNQLQECLQRTIKGKRYLLVLDDIWNDNREMWLKLKTLLMNDVKGSKILVTTRSTQVARITSELTPYILKALTEDKSWSLFTQMAFKNGVEPEGSNLVQIGKCIVAKCVGVPLAIRTIARLLYYNNTETYWLRFMEDELSKVPQEESDILPKLKLSYNHLPSYLKQCFAYCALFPKNYLIEKDCLIDLWMSQGFIQSSNTNQNLEDIGSEYFMNLLSRSFFQDATFDEWGNVTTCQLHDLMHDLATVVAGYECSALKFDEMHVDDKVRHISLDFKQVDLPWKIPSTLLKANYIRTLLLPNHLQNVGHVKDLNLENLFSSFRCLRALNLSRSNIQKLPDSVGILKHLRYLDLSYNGEIRKLPSSMTNLKYLQTLKLNSCYSLKKLPQDIRKLVGLRCLMIENCSSLIGMPCGIRFLTNLQTLSVFTLGRKDKKIAELSELKEMNNLRGKLVIEGLRNATSNPTLANFNLKLNLRCLVLIWALYSDIDDVNYQEATMEGLKPHQNLKEIHIYGFWGVTISNWLSSLSNLSFIEISYCKQCQHIPPLDQLSFLRRLFLHGLDSLEYISEKRSNDSSSRMSTSFFPSLKQLTISCCPNLKGWWRINDKEDDGEETTELSSFPCLSKLEIEFCPKMSSMPLYPSLEELILWKTNVRPLQQTLMMLMIDSETPSTSSTYSAPLSKLQSLIINNCDNFVLLYNVHEKQWEGLASLRYVSFSSMPELLYLPEGLQKVTALQHLEIDNCPNMMILPEGMQAQELIIDGCPQLLKNDCENIGVDWPSIQNENATN